MLNPTSPDGYAEMNNTSTTKEVSENQLGERSPDRAILNFLQDGERNYLTQMDLTQLTLPSSTEITGGLTMAPAAANPNYSVRIESDRPATSVKAPLRNSRGEPGIARSGGGNARRAHRPLGLVPRRSGPLTRFLRAPAKVELMGIGIDRLTEKQVIARVISTIRDGFGGWIVTPNVDHLRIIRQRPDLLAMLSQASLMVADGMPLIWASRLKGTPLPERVAGAGLILTLTTAAAKAGASIFLLGGEPDDAEAAATRLKQLNPALKIAGVACPPPGFESDPLQMAEIANALHSSKPDIVYACFGFPKQEFVIHSLRNRLPSAWFLGLGGSLAIVSGRTRRAPRWMQRTGIEWAWRLGLEPRRLFQRYIINDLPFAIRLLVGSAVRR